MDDVMRVAIHGLQGDLWPKGADGHCAPDDNVTAVPCAVFRGPDQGPLSRQGFVATGSWSWQATEFNNVDRQRNQQ